MARRVTALCAAVGLCAVTALFGASAADADLEFCALGEGAGQCGAPQFGTKRGLAVDSETGRLYVADETNNRVDVFEVDAGEGKVKFLFAFGFGVADGVSNTLQKCSVTCFTGIAGLGAGQLDRPTTVAVDNDPASLSHHAVYVADRSFRVQKFDPAGEFIWVAGKEVDKTDGGDLCTKAEVHTCGAGAQSEAEGGFFSNVLLDVGPAGVVYAVDNPRPTGDTIEERLQRFAPSGSAIPPQVTLSTAALVFARAAVVDSAGDIWVADNQALRKYSAAGNPIAGPFETGYELAIDAAGTLYTVQLESRTAPFGPFNNITAIDASTGEAFRRFAYTPAPAGTPNNGLAAHASVLGDLFFSRANGGLSYIFEPPPGPVSAVGSLEIRKLGSVKVTLAAEVNPEGEETDVHFEYLTQEEYEVQGDSFEGPATESTTPTKLGAEDFDLTAFEDLAGCPDPASEVGQPGSKCLEPETQYRWRVVATNGDGAGGGPVEGPPFETGPPIEFGELYATQPGTDTARLTAEVNPHGIPASGFFEYVDDATYLADARVAEEEGKTTEEVAEAGFAHASTAPAGAPLGFGAGEEFTTGTAALFPLTPGTLYHYRLRADNPLIEPVDSEAETLRTFAPPRVEPCGNDEARISVGAFLPDCRAYEMVSPLDKAGGDIRVLKDSVGSSTALEQSADSGEKLAYGSMRSFGNAASAPLTSQYIARRVTGREWETHSINSPRARPVSPLEQISGEFKAFSADLCDAWQLTLAEPPLAEGATAEKRNLYRRHDQLCAGGEASYETLAPAKAELLGSSVEGEHAIFDSTSQLASGGTAGQRQLYEHVRGVGRRFVCILPSGGGPVSGSCTAGSGQGNEDPGAGQRAISEDGERIFWSAPGVGEGKIYVRIGGAQTVAVSRGGEEASGTGASWFWGAAADGSAAVFSTQVGPGVSDLYEFDVDGKETHLIAENVEGVMGLASDAKRVYFASREAIAGAGENSENDEAQAGKPNLYLGEAGAGGESFKFVATLASADLNPTIENVAYRKHTAQVSPDGANAAFASVAPLTAYDNQGAQSGVPTREVYRYDAVANELSCASCNPSEARPAGAAGIPVWETGMHAARVLSDDGARLFFESGDVLTARDSNGAVDVYQWEEAGAGGCDASDAAFSSVTEGCVELISAGQGSPDSRFVEADPSGKNVFFATAASLLPQDFGVFDIYDARVEGGLPIPPIPPAPCEGDACHPQIPVPEEPTPASEGYAAPPQRPVAGKGAGKRCGKGRRLRRRKDKARCVVKRGQGRKMR